MERERRRQMCATREIPEEGEGSSGIDGYDGEVEGGVGAKDDEESGNEVLHHLGGPLPETQQTLVKNMIFLLSKLRHLDNLMEMMRPGWATSYSLMLNSSSKVMK